MADGLRDLEAMLRGAIGRGGGGNGLYKATDMARLEAASEEFVKLVMGLVAYIGNEERKAANKHRAPDGTSEQANQAGALLAEFLETRGKLLKQAWQIQMIAVQVGEARKKRKAVERHCEHCAGRKAPCGCDKDCARAEKARCYPREKKKDPAAAATTKSSDHCEHCYGRSGGCACRRGCARPPGVKCVSRTNHCDHCDGTRGLCECKAGCERKPSAECHLRHCDHCRGYGAPCACDKDCKRPDGALCYEKQKKDGTCACGGLFCGGGSSDSKSESKKSESKKSESDSSSSSSDSDT